MNARQARSLLELIADLYTVANTPEPPIVEPPKMNGEGDVAVPTTDPVKAKSGRG